MPTEILYEYRDHAGYKDSETVIFSDDPSPDCIELINQNLLDGEFFIPSQVGLIDLQDRLAEGNPLGKNDHIEHKILKIGYTELDATTDLKFVDFVKLFSTTKWDPIKAMDDHNLSCDEAISYLAQFIK